MTVLLFIMRKILLFLTKYIFAGLLFTVIYMYGCYNIFHYIKIYSTFYFTAAITVLFLILAVFYYIKQNRLSHKKHKTLLCLLIITGFFVVYCIISEYFSYYGIQIYNGWLNEILYYLFYGYTLYIVLLDTIKNIPVKNTTYKIIIILIILVLLNLMLGDTGSIVQF